MQLLKNKKNIFLIDPLDYINFLYLMKKCSLVITDSGGLQEECPSLGLPLVLMRNKTERPEIFEYEGFSMTGPDRKKIINASRKYLTLEKKKKRIFLVMEMFLKDCKNTTQRILMKKISILGWDILGYQVLLIIQSLIFTFLVMTLTKIISKP